MGISADLHKIQHLFNCIAIAVFFGDCNMAKRFIDTEIWSKDELLDSTTEQKLLFFFIVTQCNNIGVFDVSLRMASFQLGFNVTDEDVLSAPMDIEKLENGKYWMPKFCQHQYGDLKESCKPHKRYMDDLKKEGLLDRVYIGYTKSIQTLEDKDKDKEQEEDREKEMRFKAPNLQQVQSYTIEKKIMHEFDCEYYLNLRVSTGWVKANGQKVKNWKSDLLNFHKNAKKDK